MPVAKPTGRGKRLPTLRTKVAIAAVATLTTSVLTSVSPAAAVATLAAHWAMDEGIGTTAADSSGNGANGTLGSGASWTQGQVGPHGVAFNGSGTGDIDIPEPVVDTSRSFTVSAWIKLNSLTGYQTAVSIDGADISGFYLQLSNATGSFAFTRRTADDTNSTEVRADASIAPTANTWYHVVGVDDAADNSLKVYVDGLAGTEATFTSGWRATGHTMIGRGKYGGPVDFVNGSVDDVSFWSGAMTTAQVDALDRGAHWPFDEGTGSTAADASGNGHTATLSSGASWTTGRFGGHAVALNGAANITSAGPTVDTGHSFSVAAYARFSDTTGTQDVASVGGTSTGGYELQLHNGEPTFARPASDSATAAVTAVTAPTAVKPNTWYHLIGVDNSGTGTLSLYVNGLLAGTTPYTTPWTATGDTVVGDHLTGAVDDVYVTDYAMPIEQIDGIVGSGRRHAGRRHDAAAPVAEHVLRPDDRGHQPLDDRRPLPGDGQQPLHDGRCDQPGRLVGSGRFDDRAGRGHSARRGADPLAQGRSRRHGVRRGQRRLLGFPGPAAPGLPGVAVRQGDIGIPRAADADRGEPGRQPGLRGRPGSRHRHHVATTVHHAGGGSARADDGERPLRAVRQRKLRPDAVAGQRVTVPADVRQRARTACGST